MTNKSAAMEIRACTACVRMIYGSVRLPFLSAMRTVYTLKTTVRINFAMERIPGISFRDKYEPSHEKTCLCYMRTTKAQISLRISLNVELCAPKPENIICKKNI